MSVIVTRFRAEMVGGVPIIFGEPIVSSQSLAVGVVNVKGDQPMEIWRVMVDADHTLTWSNGNTEIIKAGCSDSRLLKAGQGLTQVA